MNERKKVLEIKNVSKFYGSFQALKSINFDIYEGEFFALLGPSGGGKSSLLRAMAGFEDIQQGQFLLDGKDVTKVKPNRRPVNLMFQSYALFPHMSVEKNLSYGLEMDRVPKAEISRRVGELLEMIQLREVKDRKPHQLSGGQKQRVALARALVKRPRILLLDEPLGALDKNLRTHMQLELKRIQNETGITFVIVTHDQEEALVMADRLAILSEGTIVQIGTPKDVYDNPQSLFAARFIGSMNLMEGRICGDALDAEGIGTFRAPVVGSLPEGTDACLAVRPERLILSKGGPVAGLQNIRGRVKAVAYHGQDENVHVAIGGGAEAFVVRVGATDPALGWVSEGSDVWCAWAEADSRVFARTRV